MFLANENIPLASIKKPMSQNYQTKSITLECPGIKDSEVLDSARVENLIILTFDRDYGELLFRQNLPKPRGVIYFRFAPTYPEELADLLITAIETGKISFENKYSVVERDKIRQKEI